MTKLHPSIIITRNAFDTLTTLSMVDNEGEVTEYYRTYSRPGVVDAIAVDISGELWEIEVSQRPAKPRPQRIWDESI